MTSRLPYIPFYHEAFFSGVSGLTALERGVFITLLCLMWEGSKGPLSGSEAYLARQCGTSAAAFRKAVATLVAEGKLMRDERGLFNPRALAEIERREAKVAQAVDAGKARHRKGGNKKATSTPPAKPAPALTPGPADADRPLSHKEGEGEGEGEGEKTPAQGQGRGGRPTPRAVGGLTPCPWGAGQDFPDALRPVVAAAFAGVLPPGASIPWPRVAAALEEFIDYRTQRAPPAQARLADWPRAFANDLIFKLQKGYFHAVHPPDNTGALRPNHLGPNHLGPSRSTGAGLARAFGLDTNHWRDRPADRTVEPDTGNTIDAPARDLGR